MDDRRIKRILYIYDKLIRNEIVNKQILVKKFEVDEKTIRRDFEDLDDFCNGKSEEDRKANVKYSRSEKGYKITRKSDDILSKEDVLAITKILLESRAFSKEEMEHLIKVVLKQVNSEQGKYIKELISNEQFNYEPLKHNKSILKILWDLSEYIRHKEIINVTYIKTDSTDVKRNVKPVSIIFSEYYFYLLAYIADKDYSFPAVYRVDRIKAYKSTEEHFRIPENERFEDGKFRKRVQFMFPGELMKIKFELWGTSIDAVLERLPTAKVVDKVKNKYIVEADVYGKGIMMWILSQAQFLKVLKPSDFREEVKKTIIEMQNIYV